jgi:5-methylcytosine-specific restriction endonuclease McrA
MPYKDPVKQREFYKMSSRKYRKKFPERVKLYKKRWKEKPENKEKERIYRQQYQKTPKFIFSTLRSRKRHRFLLLKEEFINWYNQQEKICYYCKRTYKESQIDDYMINIKAKRLTIDRKDNSKGYIKENIVLACRRCNNIKGDYFTEQEMLEIGKIISRRKIYSERMK